MNKLIIIGFAAMLMSASLSTKKPEKKISEKPPIEYMEVPSFVNQQANYIHYKEQLNPFFEKLKKLKNGELDRLHILHIGDSHLQAGFLPAELRYLLQTTFGHAGRGLIFPYQIAKTNAPFDIRTSSNIEWECSRNVNLSHEVPVGVCGYSMRTAKNSFNVEILLKNQGDHFNKITILGSDPNESFNIELWGSEEDGLLKTERINSSSGSCYLLDHSRTGLNVSGKKSADNPGFFTLQGILLENAGQKGILYSAAGVNGATYYAYNKSQDFVQQLIALEPDLIIVSLGTNEAADANMSADAVQLQVRKFLDNLKKQKSESPVLLVTAPDIYLRSRYKTKHGMELSDMMHDLAKSGESFAIWDFYEVMGGYGSINNWLNANLAATDRIHYTAEGYKLQGQLLFKALMKAFDDVNK